MGCILRNSCDISTDGISDGCGCCCDDDDDCCGGRLPLEALRPLLLLLLELSISLGRDCDLPLLLPPTFIFFSLLLAVGSTRRDDDLLALRPRVNVLSLGRGLDNDRPLLNCCLSLPPLLLLLPSPTTLLLPLLLLISPPLELTPPLLKL